jgi:opacity protein-like surface antigen
VRRREGLPHKTSQSFTYIYRARYNPGGAFPFQPRIRKQKTDDPAAKRIHGLMSGTLEVCSFWNRENIKMSRSFITAIALILMSSFTFAQDSPSKLQVFGGYSLFHADNGGLTGPTLDGILGAPSGTFGVVSNFNGWNAEAQYNVTRWLGVVADFSGRYGAPMTATSSSGISGLPGSSGYSFLFGPVLSYRTRSRITPFVHALVGVDSLHFNASTPVGLSSSISTSAVTDMAFAMAFGGGIDFRISRRFSIRPGQLDYVYTGHNLNGVYGAAIGPGSFQGLATSENNLRFSTGIVIRF